ncbi:MAG: tetratricopeptide repeat protein [Deltaproteobacteria bacterium]|nr:tetratricopeptide repeat protein [Deltaproteobacteria bacterium]
MDMGADWHEHYEEGRKAFEDRAYASALSHLEKVAGLKDNFADVHNMLGVIYFNDNRLEDAIKSFHKAIKINPQYTEALLNLSVVYNETGELANAQAVYAQAKATSGGVRTTYLDPVVRAKLANMHVELADVYKDLGLYDDAVREYKKALGMRPEFADIRTSLGVVYRDTRDFSKAIREMEEAARINPDYANAKIQLGLTYYMMGEKERAKAEWLKVLRTNPNDRLAKMYMSLLKRDAADGSS